MTYQDHLYTPVPSLTVSHQYESLPTIYHSLGMDSGQDTNTNADETNQRLVKDDDHLNQEKRS